MDTSSFLWCVVLAGLTLAYGITLYGVRAAKRHDVVFHGRRMVVSCTLVGIWLVAYVTKQILFGRDRFGGTADQYWGFYLPILVVHTSLAITTIGLGVTNLAIGIRRLRFGIGVGAMVAGVTHHRVLGRWLQWTFGGTVLTVYLVYGMLFHWFPAK